MIWQVLMFFRTLTLSEGSLLQDTKAALKALDRVELVKLRDSSSAFTRAVEAELLDRAEVK